MNIIVIIIPSYIILLMYAASYTILYAASPVVNVATLKLKNYIHVC